MYKFHKNKNQYFNIQYLTAKESLIPFVQNDLVLNKNTKVLEIGCAEAGILKGFLELGCHCTGIELMENRIKLAKDFLTSAPVPPLKTPPLADMNIRIHMYINFKHLMQFA